MATMSDPMSIMQGIRFGKMGDVLTRAGLQAAGISMQDILDPKKGPADIYEQVIKNLPETLKDMQPESALQFIIGRHLEKVMPVEDWMKLITPEGKVNVEEQQRILRGIQERKDRPGLTPEEGRSWADLYTAAKSFVMDIQTKLGSSLSGIATSLTQVSKGFTDLVIALLDTPAVKKALEQLKTWLDGFAEYLKTDEAKDKLKKWTEEMEKIPWAKLGEVIGSFIENLGTVLRVLMALKGATTLGTIGTLFGGPWVGAGLAALGGIGGYFAPEIGGAAWNLLTQGDPNKAGTTTAPSTTPGPQLFVPGQRNQPWPSWMDWLFGKGSVQPPTFPTQPLDPTATTPPAAIPQRQSAVIGGTNFASSLSGGNTSLAANLGGRGGTGVLSMGGIRGGSVFAQGGSVNASWRNAARNAVPSHVGGGWASMMASNNANFAGGGGGGRRGRGGPLDIDNWQLNRTAQLRIDNIAGANIYSTGVAMG
jgi:hypothetical protein